MTKMADIDCGMNRQIVVLLKVLSEEEIDTDDASLEADMNKAELEFVGWGLVGEPQDNMIVQTENGEGIDVTGYNESDYWNGDEFLGEDCFGVTPIYKTSTGEQFPDDASQYPYRA